LKYINLIAMMLLDRLIFLIKQLMQTVTNLSYKNSLITLLSPLVHYEHA